MADREIMDVDVLIVGAGPAGLSCAIRLHDAVQAHNRASPGATIAPPNVLILEKGVTVGAHNLSGAALDPRSLDELIPEWRHHNAPVKQQVTAEEILLLTQTGKHAIPGPLIPPNFHNHGNYVVSVGELSVWLAEEAKKRGIEILEGIAGAELVFSGQKVLGARCGDTGIGKDGQPRSNFQAGAEIHAKVTVLGEGVRGSLTKQIIKHASLDNDRHPQSYALGVKEIWELPSGVFPAGKIMHSLGFPLQNLPLGLGLSKSDSFGGSFLYGISDTQLIVGLVIGLDCKNPTMDPHHEFNRFKTHPHIRRMLEKGKLLKYGAKAIPEGGYYSMPRFYGDGFCLIGDSASFLNAARLKGIHLAMKSGMLAAEAIVAALANNDFSAKQLGRYEDLFQTSWARAELYAVRNWRAGYAKGILRGAIHELAQHLTKGRGFRDPLPVEADHELTARIGKRGAAAPERLKPDEKVTFNKMTDVFHSGSNHEENQPCHLKVPDLNLCVQRCTVEFGNPCQHFCPAGVYEWMLPPADAANASDKGRLNINPGNCVHCKTCDIKDPYQNIQWMVPEGGGGPRYGQM
jgi:electron-transferring-flavoprotein dehydrogenase